MNLLDSGVEPVATTFERNRCEIRQRCVQQFHGTRAANRRMQRIALYYGN